MSTGSPRTWKGELLMGDVTGDAKRDVATMLRAAERDRLPCAPVRDLLPGATVADAYEVQRINTELAVGLGRRVCGWKVGLTAKVVQQQFGVHQPDFGALFADRSCGDDEEIALDELIQPRAEAEVAFVLDSDLPDRQITAIDVLRATAFVVPAIEIVDSRVQNWDISIIDTVADNASSAMHVVGPKPTRLIDVDLREVRMTLNLDETTVSEGTGAACLSHPVNAVVWLANTLAEVGTPLRAGDLVLSGALGPMVNVVGPGRFQANISGLGTVRAHFTTAISS